MYKFSKIRDAYKNEESGRGEIFAQGRATNCSDLCACRDKQAGREEGGDYIRPAGRAPIIVRSFLGFDSVPPIIAADRGEGGHPWKNGPFPPSLPVTPFFLFNGGKPPRNLISGEIIARVRACVRLNDSCFLLFFDRGLAKRRHFVLMLLGTY